MAKTRNKISCDETATGMNKSKDSDDDVGSSLDPKNNLNVHSETDFDENDSESLQNGVCSESYMGIEIRNDYGRTVPTDGSCQRGEYGNDSLFGQGLDQDHGMAEGGSSSKDIDLVTEDGKKKKRKKMFYEDVFQRAQGGLESSSKTPVGASRTDNLEVEDREEGVDGLNSEQLDVTFEVEDDRNIFINGILDHFREVEENLDCVIGGGTEEPPPPASPIFPDDPTNFEQPDLSYEETVQGLLQLAYGHGGVAEQTPPHAARYALITERRQYCRDTVHQINDRGPCSICSLQLIDEGMVTIVFLSCKHIFHEQCIEKWFKESATCPYCRAIVVRGNCVQ